MVMLASYTWGEDSPWGEGDPGKCTGGGWIESADDPDAKATFGFNVHAIDTGGNGIADKFKGHFQYKDHDAGLKFSGVVTSAVFFPEGHKWYPAVVMNGTIRGGLGFEVWIFDSPAGEEGDWMSVKVYVPENYPIPEYYNGYNKHLGGGYIRRH
jgi:hypothetical protein